MRGFVRRNGLNQENPWQSEMQLFPFMPLKKCVGRKEDRARPSLAFSAGHLRQGQMTIGKRTKTVAKVLNRLRRRFGHSNFIQYRSSCEREAPTFAHGESG